MAVLTSLPCGSLICNFRSLPHLKISLKVKIFEVPWERERERESGVQLGSNAHLDNTAQYWTETAFILHYDTDNNC